MCVGLGVCVRSNGRIVHVCRTVRVCECRSVQQGLGLCVCVELCVCMSVGVCSKSRIVHVCRTVCVYGCMAVEWLCFGSVSLVVITVSGQLGPWYVCVYV